MNLIKIICIIFEKIRVIIFTFLLKIKYINSLNIKKKISFRKNFNIRISKHGYLEIGQGCFFNNDCSINVMGKIIIGDNCIFGENVKLYDHNHIFNKTNELIKNQGMKIGKIEIGNNCWIGSNVTILKDVIIGNNVVIGANCLINENIPSNSIVKSKDNIIIERINYK